MKMSVDGTLVCCVFRNVPSAFTCISIQMVRYEKLGMLQTTHP